MTGTLCTCWHCSENREWSNRYILTENTSVELIQGLEFGILNRVNRRLCGAKCRRISRGKQSASAIGKVQDSPGLHGSQNHAQELKTGRIYSHLGCSRVLNDIVDFDYLVCMLQLLLNRKSITDIKISSCLFLKIPFFLFYKVQKNLLLMLFSSYHTWKH